MMNINAYVEERRESLEVEMTANDRIRFRFRRGQISMYSEIECKSIVNDTNSAVTLGGFYAFLSC